MSPTRFFHVANGTATTSLIGRAGIPGPTSIWADPLHEGPVPDGLSDEQLLAVRASHLADPAGEAAVTEELKRWRSAIAAHDAYDEIVLWFEHDLFDQLNLIQLLSHLGSRAPMAGPVSLVCIDSFPGRARFKGLGELEPADLASLLETRRPVTKPEYAIAGRAWKAFRSSDPSRIDELLRADTSPLPYLAAALRRHLQEFPWVHDGLSRTERQLLRLARDGAVEIRGVFPRMHDEETAFYISDSAFWSVVRDLASCSPPLVTLAIRDESGALPAGTMALTETGRAVLAGQQDRVALSGIDRWLGGVHLEPSTSMWRWDDAQGRVVAQS